MLVLHGVLHLRTHEGPVVLQGQPNRLLLAYLGLFHDLPHSRRRLAGILRPEAAEDRALQSLRQSLYAVRTFLRPFSREAISINGDVVTLRASTIGVDVAVMDDFLERSDVGSVSHALALGQQPLLEELDEDWVVRERALRDDALRTAAGRTVERLEKCGRITEALALSRKALRRDPADELMQRSAFRLHAALHDSAGLARQYQH